MPGTTCRRCSGSGFWAKAKGLGFGFGIFKLYVRLKVLRPRGCRVRIFISRRVKTLLAVTGRARTKALCELSDCLLRTDSSVSTKILNRMDVWTLAFGSRNLALWPNPIQRKFS